jgi:hypothetical protein
MSSPRTVTPYRARTRRTIAAALTGAVLTIGAIGVTATAAQANTVGRGSAGQTLTVSKAGNISRSGETVTVTGAGFDTSKGIYVAYCVDNGAGQVASPCGGGVDMTGSTGASTWISNDPPSYAQDLVIPYGPGGSFSAQVQVTAKIGDVDCTVRRCVVSTRADHTRGSDRSQDVKVPVTFASGQSGSTGGGATGGQSGTTGGQTGTTGGQSGTTGGQNGTTGGQAPGTTAGSVAPDNEADLDAAAAQATGNDSVEVSRVSSAGDNSQLWTMALIGVGAIALLLIITKLLRRRAAK